MKNLLNSLFLMLSFCLITHTAIAAQAFDVTGTWSGTVTLDNGNELPFVAILEQRGTSVTGVLAGIGGAPDVTISNGRIEDDTLRFDGVRQIQGEAVAFEYIGSFVGESINFTIIRVGATGPNSVLNTITTRQP